jgi:16S rRNA (guanine527-N7)-methyltransferase
VNRTSGAATRRPPGEENGAGSGRRGEGDRGASGRPTEDPRAPLPSHVSEVPDLPPAARDALRAALPALGIEPSPDLLAGLEGHLRLLLAWTTAVNLTAIRDPADAVRLHVLDSLAAVPVLRARGVDAFVDVGTGGGYPGLAVALALPARRALLVDSVAKKVRFVATAIDALAVGDRVEAWAGRAEALAADPAHRGRWPGVLARAVADLADVAEVSLPLLAHGGTLVAWKREPVTAELAAARARIADLGGGRAHVERVDAPGLEGHRLVIVTKVRRTPDRYPRDPAVRAREPRPAPVS